MSAQSGNVVGLVLAGGQARRMGGGDKCLLPLAGRPILDHILERLRPQVGAIALNANGPPERFEAYGLPVLADVVEGHQGPLAGILTGLLWARRAAPQATWMLSVPGDGPLLPRDLTQRLLQTLTEEGSQLACAASGGRAHPVIGLWPLSLADNLRQAVVEEGIRKVDLWTGRFRLSEVAWDTQDGDPFANVNRPEDLLRAEAVLTARQ